MLVAAFPQPAHGNSEAHTAAAAVAFTALAVWPIFASKGSSRAPLLSRSVSAAAVCVLLGLVAWFVAELYGDKRGLAERVASGAQALWPLAVVITSRLTLGESR